jgi:hypothetical protein
LNNKTGGDDFLSWEVSFVKKILKAKKKKIKKLTQRLTFWHWNTKSFDLFLLNTVTTLRVPFRVVIFGPHFLGLIHGWMG